MAVSERLRALHQAQPFQPFIVHMSDGRSLRVTHPELLAIAPTGRWAMVISPDESTHYIDILLVTDLEVKKQKDKNGKWGGGEGGGKRKAG